MNSIFLVLIRYGGVNNIVNTAKYSQCEFKEKNYSFKSWSNIASMSKASSYLCISKTIPIEKVRPPHIRSNNTEFRIM